MSESTYQAHTERHGDTYQPKMREILESIRKEAVARGYLCDEPFDMTDECYRWSVLVRPGGTPKDADVGVDVAIQIAESHAYGDGEAGLNFMLDMVEYGGLIVGGLAPYNYTSDCWVPVDDDEAVAYRWRIFSDAFDASTVLDRIEEHYAKAA
jgi:hypothetical protein